MSNISERVDQLSSSQKLLLALKEARTQLEAVERSKTEPIAIIGIGCRFPGGANDPEAFWRLLRDGVDAIREVPKDRWDIDAYYDPDPDAPGKMYARSGGFLKQIDQFEAEFFGISPREAMSMDPQQRLLLEVSWEALENAGQPPDQLAGSQTGIFMGIGQNDYAQLQLNSGTPASIQAYDGTGNGFCFASGRLSYVLGLQGPNVAIDTACSASLVAIHLACQSLRSGECNLALAGGVQLTLSPEVTIFLSRAHALSPDGRCKTFDAAANGYGRGEGCGIVVLKRLSDAVANGDNILALIRGSAVNHDGRSSGLTVPNKQAQQALIRQALANARVEPSQIDYVEAHGTGTSLGDPIEVRALAAVLGEGRSPDHPLILGSVKTNIGHLEAAAGVASLIKVVLALQHKEIPPHLHFKQRNPHINWDELPVIIPKSRIRWSSQQKRQLAGISSFGISGTNAHMVLEAAPEPEPEQAEQKRPLHLLTLSAKTEDALLQLASRYEKHLATNTNLLIEDICFTANTGRSHFRHRLSVVVSSSTQLYEKLAAFTAGQEVEGVIQGVVQGINPPKVAFLFTGQGSQYVDMGRQLYETQPTFRRTLNRCAEILRPYLEKPLLEVLYSSAKRETGEWRDGEEKSPNHFLNETAYTQPALFALEYALAKLWQSWDIKPDVVMGHSVGEYVAACVAGVFSLEDGLKLIAERARLMQTLPQDGEMVAVFADEAKVTAAIQPYAQEVTIAAINGSKRIVISGKSQAVEKVIAALKAQGVKTKKLNVSHAFHSPLMEPMLAAFERVAANVKYSLPHIGLISNVTGELATTEIATPDYWCRHIRQPVRFAASIKTLAQLGYQVFVECGPTPTLLAMGRDCMPKNVGVWLPTLRPGQQDWQQILESLGNLNVLGMPVDWSGFYRDYRHRRLQLPTYPFQRQRYWIETTAPETRRLLPHSQSKLTAIHPLLGKKVQSPLLKETLFESYFSVDSLPFLGDHWVYEKIVVPGACHISLLLGAIELTFKTQGCILENILFPQALILPEQGMFTIQLAIVPEEDESRATFKLISLETDGVPERSIWIVHATGRILAREQEIVSTHYLSSSYIQEVQARCQQEMTSTEIYKKLRQHQIQLGPSFQWIRSIWKGDREALCQMEIPESIDSVERYQLHPGLVDSCFQLLAATVATEEKETFVPFSIEKFGFYQSPKSSKLWCHARLRLVEESEAEKLIADIRLFEQTGEVIAEVTGFEGKQVTRESLLRSLKKDVGDWFYQIVWQPQSRENNSESLQTQALGSWLIFADKGGIGLKLAKILEERGNRCVLVFSGQTYKRLGAKHYQISPAEPLDFQRLLQDLKTHHTPYVEDNPLPYHGFVHLWSLDETPGENATIESLQTAQVLGCGSVLHLVQALAQAGWSGVPRLWLGTKGTQPVKSAPTPLQVQQAPLWGLGRVIALEHPNLQCVCLDLDPLGEVDNIQALFEELSFPDPENQIAYRQGVRHVARLVRYTPPVPENPLPVDSNSSYLITGGLGSLGLKVAHWLVEKGAKHLLLIGRSKASDAANEAVRQLEQGGAQVLVVQADVSHQEDVARVLKIAKSSLPPLRGIIHAAGVLDDGVLVQQNWERFARVMAPKVNGARNLHFLTQDLSLDFFVCFSSAASLVGSPGQGNYASANAFLDALAHHRKSLGLHGLSINWGLWAEIGMVTSLGRREQDRLDAQGLAPIFPNQGLQVLEHLLKQGAAQVGVLPVDWSKFRKKFSDDEPPLLSELVRQEKQQLKEEQQIVKRLEFLRQLEGVSPEEHRSLLINYIREQTARVLGLSASQIDVQQPLTTIGLDSLMALEIGNRLKTELGVDVAIVKFLEGCSVASLVTHVIKQLTTAQLSSFHEINLIEGEI